MAHNHSSSAPLLQLALLLVQLSIWRSGATMFYGTASFTRPPYHSSCTDGITTNYETFAAVPSWVYQDGVACGTKYRVTCADEACLANGPTSITVTVADVCTPDKPTEPCPTLVLSEETFQTFADTDAGIIAIYYELID